MRLYPYTYIYMCMSSRTRASKHKSVKGNVSRAPFAHLSLSVDARFLPSYFFLSLHISELKYSFEKRKLVSCAHLYLYVVYPSLSQGIHLNGISVGADRGKKDIRAFHSHQHLQKAKSKATTTTTTFFCAFYQQDNDMYIHIDDNNGDQRITYFVIGFLGLLHA